VGGRAVQITYAFGFRVEKYIKNILVFCGKNIFTGDVNKSKK
jgi:hypothetical protein